MGKKGEEAKLGQEGYGSGKERNRMGAKHGGCHKKKKGNLERMIVSWRRGVRTGGKGGREVGEKMLGTGLNGRWGLEANRVDISGKSLMTGRRGLGIRGKGTKNCERRGYGTGREQRRGWVETGVRKRKALKIREKDQTEGRDLIFATDSKLTSNVFIVLFQILFKCSQLLFQFFLISTLKTFVKCRHKLYTTNEIILIKYDCITRVWWGMFLYGMFWGRGCPISDSSDILAINY